MLFSVFQMIQRVGAQPQSNPATNNCRDRGKPAVPWTAFAGEDAAADGEQTEVYCSHAHGLRRSGW